MLVIFEPIEPLLPLLPKSLQRRLIRNIAIFRRVLIWWLAHEGIGCLVGDIRTSNSH